MTLYRSYFWKRAPFVKILFAFIPGIIVQWYFQIPANTAWLFLISSLIVTFLLSFFSFFTRYKYSFLRGISLSALFFCTGMILARRQDIRNDKRWLGHSYENGDALWVTLDEPPVEKTRSYKTEATARFLIKEDQAVPVKARIIIYFRKDSTDNKASPDSRLIYGTQILLKKPLQEIKNSGNPGGFDYKRHSLFRGITHQVFLNNDEYQVLAAKKGKRLKKIIYASREKVLAILRKNITSEKELGLAEALLIGYKDDLEQSLVQSYTNTGVVHIIAISGLHIGLIYWLLTLLLKPLRQYSKMKWFRTLLILGGLWAFSLLAGGQPSVLRSAFMFSFIALGESLNRKTSIFNSISVSAFILLAINPYWLWDVGFQLSYAAVLSIIIFMRPIYSWFYFPNKILDFFWKLNAVTLAAQVLTVPLSIYYFHQFPNLFILTNFVAVPLSSLLLLGEILLCAIAFIPAAASLLGQLIAWLTWLMNTYIEKIEKIGFSLWDGLQINLWQTFLLILFAACSSYWLMERSKMGLKAGLLMLLAFISLRSYSFMASTRQQKIIVYNVPQKRAVDIVNGRSCFFIGDTELLINDFARNFHLKPARILFRINDTDSLPGLWIENNLIHYLGKRILLLDKQVSFRYQNPKPVIDLLLLSKNPRIYMKKLAAVLDLKQVVFDASVPAWKANYWKRDCDSLHIPWHDVTMKGAFVMSLR